MFDCPNVPNCGRTSPPIASLFLLSVFCVFSDVPSNPYSVRLSAVSQRLATVAFMKPDSHGGVPISYYLVQYKEGSQDWRDVKSHSVQSESCFLIRVFFVVVRNLTVIGDQASWRPTLAP